MFRTSYKANEENTTPGEFLWARFMNTVVFRPTMKDALDHVRMNIDEQRRNIQRKKVREEKELKQRERNLARKIEGNTSTPDLPELARQIFEQRLWIKELVAIETDLQTATRQLDLVEARQTEQAVFEGLNKIYHDLTAKMHKRNPVEVVKTHQQDKERFNMYMEMYRDGFREGDEFNKAEQDSAAILDQFISEKNLKLPETPNDPVLSELVRKREQKEALASSVSGSSSSGGITYKTGAGGNNLIKQQVPSTSLVLDRNGCVTHNPKQNTSNKSMDDDDLFARFEKLKE